MTHPIIEQALRSGPCRECKAQLEVIGVRGLGVREPKRDEPVAGQPVVFILVECVGCGADNTVATVTGVEQAIGVLRWMFETFNPAPASGDPAPGSPGAPGTPGSRPSASACRPSLRPRQPRGPLTDREVQVFIRLLNRTSMRRNSKSFAGFMKRLKARPSDHGLGCDFKEKKDES